MAYLKDKVACSCALSHSESYSSWQVHRLCALGPAIQHMTACLRAHAVGVTVPDSLRSCWLGTTCTENIKCVPQLIILLPCRNKESRWSYDSS